GLLRGERAAEGQFSIPYYVARTEHELWSGRPADALSTAQRGLGDVDATALGWYAMPLAAAAARASAELAEFARARRDTALSSVARQGWDVLAASLAAADAPGSFSPAAAPGATQGDTRR